MKRSEVIKKYRQEIEAEMERMYRNVVSCYGRIQYQLYIWEDGEIEALQGPQGDNSYLKEKDWEPRTLYYVTKIGGSYINLWDFTDHSKPDDESEAEQEEEEIIEWLVNEYHADEVLDEVIEEYERQEKYEED